MNIKLADKSPAMWFLGEPRKLKVSLTYLTPGPVNIEFESLSEAEKKSVILAVRGNILESDQPVAELINIYKKMHPEHIAKPAIPQQKPKKPIDMISVKVEEELKLKDSCRQLLDHSVRAILSSIKKEQNTKVLRLLLQIEQQGKKRKSIIKATNDKIQKLQSSIVVNIEDNVSSAVLNIKQEDPMFGDIIDSEHEIVSFASGKPLRNN